MRARLPSELQNRIMLNISELFRSVWRVRLLQKLELCARCRARIVAITMTMRHTNLVVPMCRLVVMLTEPRCWRVLLRNIRNRHTIRRRCSIWDWYISTWVIMTSRSTITIALFHLLRNLRRREMQCRVYARYMWQRAISTTTSLMPSAREWSAI